MNPPPSGVTPEERFLGEIKTALVDNLRYILEKEAEKVIAEANKKIEARVRGYIAKVACQIADQVCIDTMVRNVVVKIEFPKDL